jgi:hypothetical protein
MHLFPADEWVETVVLVRVCSDWTQAPGDYSQEMLPRPKVTLDELKSKFSRAKSKYVLCAFYVEMSSLSCRRCSCVQAPCCDQVHHADGAAGSLGVLERLRQEKSTAGLPGVGQQAER